jgi:hypothetical protein
MHKVCRLNLKLLMLCLLVGGAMAASTQLAMAQSQAQSTSDLTARIQDLEKQLAELTAKQNAQAQVAAAPAQGQRGAPTPAAPAGQGQRGGQAPAAPAGQGQRGAPAAPPMNMPMPAAGPAGGDPQNPEGNVPDSTDPQALLDRIKSLEQRIRDLETTTVYSEPETRTKRKEVYVDKNGIETDTPAPGAKKTVTYERERVYRRQTINEKIEEALSTAEEHSVKVGVNAGIVTQFAHRTEGEPIVPNNHFYELASADLFFTAGIAQNTVFFADVVGLSGPPPDLELGTLTLVNGYSARLVNQNELNLREAWLRTELFSNKLGISAGRLDLTNYFDHNVAANDETSQFISDALVNNPALGLAINGAGLAVVYDPKGGFTFKGGFQQSNTDAKSLNESIFSLAEVGYVSRIPGMGEGNYRVWYRTDNAGGAGYNSGYGTSIDQKIGPQVTLFARYGAADSDIEKRDHFYSGGVQFAQGLGFYPGDKWGVGYSHYDTATLGKERLVEGYYNFSLTEKLTLSFHLQHFWELRQGAPTQGYLVPGVRLQASF